MFFLFLTLYVFLIFFSLLKIKDFISRNVIIAYLSVWFIPLAISTFQPYGHYEISTYAYSLLFLNVLSFYCGFILINIKNFRYDLLNLLYNEVERIASNKYFSLFIILITFHVAYAYSITYSSLSYTGDLSATRTLYYEGNFFPSHFNIPYIFFYPAIGFILESMLFLLLFYRKRYFLVFVSGVYIFFLHSLKGSRIGYMEILCFLIFFLFCSKSSGEKKRKFYLLFYLFLISIFLISSYTSFLRHKDKNLGENNIVFGINELCHTIIGYPTGAFVAFDYALHNDYQENFGGYQYGRATFSSLDGLCGIFLRKIGIDYSKAAEYASFLNENRINISSQSVGQTWNALYTSALYHYLDFGIFGIFLFPFAIGCFLRYCLYLFYQIPSFALYILLSYLFYVVIFTPLRFIPVFFYDFPFIIVLFFISSYKLIRHKKLSYYK